MVELVDTPDLGSGAAMRVGSSPIRRTTGKRSHSAPLFLFCPTDICSPPAIHYHSSFPSRPHYGRNEQKITTKTQNRGKDYPSCREHVGAEGFIGGCEGEGENGLWTVDTVDTPFSEVHTNKDGIILRGAILCCIGKQSPLTVKTPPDPSPTLPQGEGV